MEYDAIKHIVEAVEKEDTIRVLNAIRMACKNYTLAATFENMLHVAENTVLFNRMQKGE